MQQPPFVIFQRDPNGTVTQSIAQGIATLGQAWANASKQYWANMRLLGYLVPSYYWVNVIQTLAEHRRYQVHLPSLSDGNFGKQLANGSWNGMLGMVVKKVLAVIRCMPIKLNRNETRIYRRSIWAWANFPSRIRDRKSSIFPCRSTRTRPLFWFLPHRKKTSFSCPKQLQSS